MSCGRFGLPQRCCASLDYNRGEHHGVRYVLKLCIRATCSLFRFLADKGPLRNAKLKLIPSLAQGSWVVRQAVGQTPVMLGKRLKTEYFMENAYVEADVDISANATAAGVTSMVAGAIKSLVFDIGILLEVRRPSRRLWSLRRTANCFGARR
jgi:hypothetical protein